MEMTRNAQLIDSYEENARACETVAHDYAARADREEWDGPGSFGEQLRHKAAAARRRAATWRRKAAALR